MPHRHQFHQLDPCGDCMFAKCNINQTVNLVDNDNICHISSDSEYFYDLPIYSGKVINYLFTEYIFP